MALNGSAATGTGPVFALGYGCDRFGVQVATTGTPASFSLALEGSLDGVNFVALGSAVTATGLSMITLSGPVCFVRFNLTALSGGTAPTVTARFCPTGRAAIGQSAPMLVQSTAFKSVSPGTSLATNAFGAATTNGNTILAAVLSEPNGLVTGVTDSAGNTYTRDFRGVNGSRNNCDIWRCSNIIGGSGVTLAITASGAAYITASTAEFQGLAASSPVDGAGSTNNGSAGAQPSTGSFSTAHLIDVLIVAYASGQTSVAGSVPSGFTLIANHTSNGVDEDGAWAYQMVTAAQSGINEAWTGTTQADIWAAVGCAYKGS